VEINYKDDTCTRELCIKKHRKCTRQQKRTKKGEKVGCGAGRKRFNPTGFTVRM